MGTESLCDGADVVVPFVVEEVVVVAVVVDDVELVEVDVVLDVDVASDAIANPQPRNGSFSVRGSEAGNWNRFGPGIDVVVVVSVVVPVDSAVVVVVGELVVVDAAVLFLESSRSEPTSRSTTSMTQRTMRKSQRRWVWEFG